MFVDNFGRLKTTEKFFPVSEDRGDEMFMKIDEKRAESQVTGEILFFNDGDLVKTD